ncbi:MAG: LysR family transcriptional regulator [Candidatus Sulfobium sp.]|jgi:DNA-binding transcriptional LysR family regulator
MEDHRLRAFCLVFEMRSFSKAAEAIFLTQSAVSHLIRNLEDELGAALLIRRGKTVSPTPAGRLFYAYAKRIMAQYQEMESEIRNRIGSVRGPLHIGATPTIAAYLLPQVFYGFSRQYPGVMIELSDMNSEKIVAHLLEGRLEIGFLDAGTGHPSLSAEAIAEDEIVLIASDDNPLAKTGSPGPGDLASQPFILPEPGSATREFIEGLLKELGIAPRKLKIPMILGNPELTVAMVQSGVGISFVSRWAAKKALLDGSVRCVEIPGRRRRRNFYLVFAGKEPSTAPASAFRNFVRGFNFFTPYY